MKNVLFSVFFLPRKQIRLIKQLEISEGGEGIDFNKFQSANTRELMGYRKMRAKAHHTVHFITLTYIKSVREAYFIMTYGRVYLEFQ